MSLSIKKLFALFIIVTALIPATTCMRQSFGDVLISMNNEYRSWNDGTYACSCNAYRNPVDANGYHYLYEGVTGSGLYKIMPQGALLPLEVYCDMDTDGGGWTLVLLNSQYPTSPTPMWDQAINNNNIEGSFSNGLDTGLDLLLGLKYWNKLGTKLRVEAGGDSTSLVHQAYYSFNLTDSGANPFYNINLSDQNIVSTNKIVPGLFAYHNSRPFSTKDKDNDASTSDCSRNYGNTAWWHVSCWDGSFWGLSSTSKPYWTGSGSDYYEWGAFWIR